MTNTIIKYNLLLVLFFNINSCKNDSFIKKRTNVQSYIISKFDTNYVKYGKSFTHLKKYLNKENSKLKYFNAFHLLVDSAYNQYLKSNIICYNSKDFDSNNYLKIFAFDTINGINSSVFSNGNFTFSNNLYFEFERLGKGETTIESIKDLGFNHLNTFFYEKYCLGDTEIVKSENIVKFIQYLYSLYNYQIIEVSNIDSLADSFIYFSKHIEDDSRKKISSNAYSEVNKFINFNKKEIKAFVVKKIKKNGKKLIINHYDETTENILLIHFSEGVNFDNPAAKRNWFFDIYCVPVNFSHLSPIF